MTPLEVDAKESLSSRYCFQGHESPSGPDPIQSESTKLCNRSSAETFPSQDGRVQTVEPVNRPQGLNVLEECHDKMSVAY
ncbi:hypothetical protein DPX16_13080 [Anabarilius grahami]|uniref:Uncharacterized protein n=1 Tax=Anabarilius grahami TaxID=495550 RepID=A0A3N0XDY4_ANAGA|nr:hypothetical protein DPX16_13080 [Anabarilius grahami]